MPNDWHPKHSGYWRALVIGLGLVFLLTGLFACGVESKQDCSAYAEWRMKNVPARCIAYFEGR